MIPTCKHVRKEKLYDPASKNLIWRGAAAETLNPGDNEQKNMEKLNKGVAKLLKHFPPQRKADQHPVNGF